MDGSKHLSAAEYLGYRLKELGVTHIFCVPGDYNLPLLDGLAQVPGITLVNTANELNAAYAADGHARSQGLGCVVTTLLVGALSAINGIAASFAEEMPVLSVVGVPTTSQYANTGAIHHTLGNMEDISQEVACYRPVTVYQTVLRSLKDARYLIDKALAKTLYHRKPVLLEVCRDVALLPHASFGLRGEPLEPFARPPRPVSEDSLALAADAIAKWLAPKKRPLIVVGRRARHYPKQLVQFAEASGFAVTVVADGKSFFPEDHPQFIGTYFKGFSDPASISETVAAADALVFVGVHFNEMSWPIVPDSATHERSVILYKSRAVLSLGHAYGGVPASRLLPALAGTVKPNGGALVYFKSVPAAPPALPLNGPDFTAPDGAPLKTEQVYGLVQTHLLSSPGHDVIIDTGDALWRSHKMRLPPGTCYETQCLAGNIGAGLPTGLGFSLGAAQKTGHRSVVFIGDGGLQMTAQELGTFVRFGSNAIVIVINNDGYLVERCLSPIIHSSYNYLAPWDYCAVAEAMCKNVPGGRFKVLRATTLAEAAAAVAAAKAAGDCFVFIEAVVAKTDAADGAGALRRGFIGEFFSAIPLYQRRLANELGAEFVKTTGAAAMKRAVSDSLSEAFAQAAALAPRLSGEFGTRTPPPALPLEGAMPTIASVGSLAGELLTASGSGGDLDAAPAGANGAAAAANGAAAPANGAAAPDVAARA